MTQGIPFYDYGITPGASIANPRNVESLVKFPPTVNPNMLVPSVGPIMELTLDNGAQFNGTFPLDWFWPAMSIADFQTLFLWIFSSYTVGSTPVSLKTRSDQEVFSKYNAMALRPLIGSTYERGHSLHYRNVRFPFRITVLTPYA